ncbi:hypothetical protein MJT46_012627 [Ovis ammon polii x Ovis aries]|nr:hypothetical protein MJT46_012627 [Ovis ammon polii x Ovis aries]
MNRLDNSMEGVHVQFVNDLKLEEKDWIRLGRKIKTFATKMVITSGNDEDRGGQEKESKEESVLAMLGIIGTILNLIVIIFVYIYTTL